MRASYHDSGQVAVVRDRLNNLVRLGTIASIHFRSFPLNPLAH